MSYADPHLTRDALAIAAKLRRKRARSALIAGFLSNLGTPEYERLAANSRHATEAKRVRDQADPTFRAEVHAEWLREQVRSGLTAAVRARAAKLLALVGGAR